jgi:3-deoxy-D-manno-octulosonate 8-phosphate phosphatase (KDO 8-P phosphatase)
MTFSGAKWSSALSTPCVGHIVNVIAKAQRVKLAIFDVDGVLTDGGLYYSEAGDAMKKFDVRDGMGMKLLQDAGIELAIITSRRAASVRLRAADLSIMRVQQGVAKKLAAFETLLAETGCAAEETAFLGDDLVDLPVLRRCGFAVTVADAPASIKRHADYVTRAAGGHGAAREFCEIIRHSRSLLASCSGEIPGKPGR